MTCACLMLEAVSSEDCSVLVLSQCGLEFSVHQQFWRTVRDFSKEGKGGIFPS